MAESMWDMWTVQQFGQIFHWRDANFFNVNSNCENLNGLTEKMYLRNVKNVFFLGPIHVICTVGKTFWQNDKMDFWKSWTDCRVVCEKVEWMSTSLSIFPQRSVWLQAGKKEKHRTLFDGFFMLHETSQGFQTNASQIWFNQFWRVWNYSVNLCPRLPEHLKLVKPQSTVIYCVQFYSRKKHLFEFPLLNIWASQES